MNNYMVTRELKHEAWCDHELFSWTCGSQKSHNQGICPTNNIDNHYELNVLFDTLVKAKNLKEAREMQLDWKIKIKQDEELDDYLKEVGITKFNHYDFEKPFTWGIFAADKPESSEIILAKWKDYKISVQGNGYKGEDLKVKRLNKEQYDIFKKSDDDKGYRLRITHQRMAKITHKNGIFIWLQ